jgi:hypothetical protein
MKKLVFLACIMPLMLILCGCDCTPKVELSQADFNKPPESVGIYTWWHWLDNAITKEGITRDLEAMKEQGIAGATILNIGLFDEKDMGVPQVIFGTEQWYDMFKWALQEANRLGLTMGAHNCDGWSTSGGPWITPETSMKQFVWNKTYINGGQPVDTVLARPYGLMNYYEDAAVVAYPSNDTPSSFQRARPSVTIGDSFDGSILYDGNPYSTINLKNDVPVIFAFGQPFVAEKIAIHLRIPSSWASLKDFHAILEIGASDDGKHFRHLADIEVPGVNETYMPEIPKTEAKYFSVILKEQSQLRNEVSCSLSEIELLKKEEHPLYAPSFKYHLEKITSTRPEEVSDIFVKQSLPCSGSTIEASVVTDLSGKMNTEGRLQWEAPAGSWTIIRFGYTTTGVQNGPATNAGRGLECDKMDTAALNLHFRSFPMKLIDAAGDLAGNTFRYLFIDSWECNFQNWTKSFPQEFERRRGYSLIPWIPVLCGETENNTEETEAFLQDFRVTIADLIEENYFKHFRELCHLQGMDMHAEVIYGGVHYPSLDILRSNSYVDVPMWEFWTGQDKDGFVHYNPVQNTTFDKPMYAAVIYNKSILPSEAYTGFAHYSESPWDLKLYGDRAYCEGINRMVLHSYVHQPTERKPGMTLGPFASHFNRHNNWWQHVSGWFTYQARVQYILQKGQVISDILYFIGDQMPEYQKGNDLFQVPYGYNIQLCNKDILFNQSEVEDGLIELENELSFKILLLPDNEQLEYATLQRIATLVEDGATVVGPRPVSVCSYKNREQNNAALKVLADRVWGNIDGSSVTENVYGKGKVIWGIPLERVLAEMNIPPDFECLKDDSINLLFIHKKIGSRDVYFLVNQEDRAIQTECIFRVTGKTPEIWNPQYGTAYMQAVYRDENGRTRLPFHFRPKESVFVIFSEDDQKDHIIAVRKGEAQLFPLTGIPAADYFIPEISQQDNAFSGVSDLPGDYLLTTSDGQDLPLTSGGKESYEIRDFTGSLSFESMDGSIEPVEINNFQYWTDFGDPAIKYYSGKAKYSVYFTIPENNITGSDSLSLSVGDIKATGEIILNGHKLGYAWMPFQKFNVTGLLVPGENKLEAVIANVYRNRLIGDLMQYGEIKNSWTTSPVQQFLNKDMKLQESGIAGPVTITRTKVVSVLMKK